MESSFIQSFFLLITDNIFVIIYFFALIEISLIFSLLGLMKRHELTLMDISDNLLKGLSDAPDKDSNQSISERLRTALDYMGEKLTSSPEFKERFSKNLQRIQERPLYNRHYKLEMISSVVGTLVQIFPLLGILGTILAIAQTAFQKAGDVDVSSLSNAFVLAMDTTILGISFSIIFMIAESLLNPRIERIINESLDYRKLMAQITVRPLQVSDVSKT